MQNMASARGPVMEAVLTAFATEPGEWPEDVELYQPDKSNMLLTDAAKCTSVEVYLKFCRLPYTSKFCQNAEFMSPNGEVPLLRAKKEIAGGTQAVFSYVQNKGLSTSNDLEPQEKAEMMAYISLVEMSLLPAELHMLWCNKDWSLRSRHQYGNQYPLPLNVILSYKKKWSVWSYLRAINWHLKTEQEVIEEFKRCCQALSEKLGDHNYFMQDRPTELDAIVFGHLYALLTRYQVNDSLSSVVRKHKNLMDFVNRIVENFMSFTER
ncbi:metaxin-2 [Exaiptasia diaphana]|uniref:Metaxin-2 n=1 Tax=Exaiptasia diaphana TaxID=2652724 RepID=A0A913YAI4_EXADI|nr:metaxin-2 [Exaiptasia diaphana]KXJ28324.1 Metaxin-2 [Exaiptasia diaphana]